MSPVDFLSSRGDIAPVSGTFRTPAGGDTITPDTSEMQIINKDAFAIIVGITPTELLTSIEVTLTDIVTNIAKKYYFFDLAANAFQLLLLDGLEAGKTYHFELLMWDTNGNGSFAGYFNISTPALDETPPAITQNTVTVRTATTATLHLVTNEILKKLKVRYRVVGTAEWLEQTILPTTTAVDINLTGLLTGQSYEYQYTLEDQSANQTLTEWRGL